MTTTRVYLPQIEPDDDMNITSENVYLSHSGAIKELFDMAAAHETQIKEVMEQSPEEYAEQNGDPMDPDDPDDDPEDHDEFFSLRAAYHAAVKLETEDAWQAALDELEGLRDDGTINWLPSIEELNLVQPAA